MGVLSRQLKKWVSILVCVCFITTLSPEAFAQIPSLQMSVKAETPRLVNIDIPTELATVEDWYEAPSNPKPRLVVHIEDAHSNYEAQSRIRDLIEYLNKNHGFKTILVEGAASELDPKILKLFSDQKLNVKLADELAKIGEITGAEMYMVEHEEDGVKALGIEKPELYRKNFDALRKVYSDDDFVSGFFDAYESKLGQVASRTFGPRMIQALAEWKKFESGHRDFLPFVSKLAELAKKVLNIDLNVLYSQIEWPQLTRLLVLQRVEKELDKRPEIAREEPSRLPLREQALAEKQEVIKFLREKGVRDGLIQGIERLDEKSANLNRIGSSEMRQAGAPRLLLETLVEEGGRVGFDIRKYPAFAKYAGYLILRSEISPSDLFDEIKKLFDLVLEKLVKEAPSSAKVDSSDEAERGRLLLLHRDEMLARKLLRLELSHDEWLAVLNRQDRFYPEDLNRRMFEALGQNPRTQDLSEKGIAQMKNLKESFSAAFAFYSAAVNRETYFFQRTQEILDQTDRIILITGGFHTEGMKYLFRKYDINYGTLTPRITQNFSNDVYRKVMMEGASTAEKAPRAPKEHEAIQNNKLSAADLTMQDQVALGTMIGDALGARQSTLRLEAEKLGGKTQVKQSDGGVGESSKLAQQAGQKRSPSEAHPSFSQKIQSWFSNPFNRFTAGALIMSSAMIALALGFAAALPAGLAVLFGLSLVLPAIGINLLAELLRYTLNASVATAVVFSAFLPVRANASLRGASSVQVSVANLTTQASGAIATKALPKADTLNDVIEKINITRKAELGPKRKVPAELILSLISLARNSQNPADRKEALRILSRVKSGDIVRTPENEAQVQLAIAAFKLLVSIEEESSKNRDNERKEVIAQRVRDRASAENYFPPELREALSKMVYADWAQFAQGLDNLTAVEAVAFLVTFDIFAEHVSGLKRAAGLRKLTSIVASKVAPDQMNELTQMLQTFFPEMFSKDAGYLNVVISSKNSQSIIKMMKLHALLDSELKINVFVIGDEEGFLELAGNLKVHKLRNFESVKQSLQNSGARGVFKPATGGVQGLLVVSSGVLEAENLGSLTRSLPDLQVVSDSREDTVNDLLASTAMVLGAKKLMNGDSSISGMEDGIDRSSDKRKVWIISNESLSRIKELGRQFLAALKVMVSA